MNNNFLVNENKENIVENSHVVSSTKETPIQKSVDLSLFGQASQKQIIKAFMSLRGLSQTKIAKKYGFHQSEISRVINGERKTKHIRKALSIELGMPEDQIFPKKKPGRF